MKNQDRKILDLILWGSLVGKLAIDEKGIGHFKYSPEFLSKGLEPAPIWMPVKKDVIYSFPKLNPETFRGLPGMIADSLPDAYGNRLLDIYFDQKGIRNAANIEILKLCYISTKASGALEYAPPLTKVEDQVGNLSIHSLLETVDALISSKKGLEMGDLNNIQDIISVGSSLGGAAPKAVIDIDFESGSIRPGNIPNPPEYESWIIKFDTTNTGQEYQFAQSSGFGNVEYAYSVMAKKAGINMTACRLYQDDGRSHFMTKRFDRVNGEKIHLQTLHGIAHMDSYLPHDYKTYFRVLSRLKLDHAQHEELFRRIVFNGIAANTDTHTKNTSFLMDQNGKWSLSPCYDLICTVSMRTNIERHKTLINGKTHGFTKEDYFQVAKDAGIKGSRARIIFDEVCDAVVEWKTVAQESGVRDDHINHVQNLIHKNLNLATFSR